ncbi:hypothetical protein EGW08_003741 [Elysia chlorotica]|uniref:DNA mismatch repair proteins mutS family domain-containing protein n=1 Tax=Elysia chlorotica TaxID=188477 RepID=A0A3S1ACP8_ELYCH|nr:hypothetical protein EGW08_003741 [Elysia chlorotica]
MNGEELVFLYQIKEGSASSSYACHIAAQVGIPQNIVKRGEMVSELLSQNKSVPCMKGASPNENRKRHQEIVEAFMKLDLDRDSLQTFLKDFVLTAKVPAQSKTKSGHHQQQQRLQETLALAKTKTAANPLAIPALAQAGPSTNSHVQEITPTSNDIPDGFTQDVATSNGRKSQIPKDQAVSDLQAEGRNTHTKLNCSPMSDLWSKNNFKGLLQRKYAAAARMLEAPGAGLAMESFVKTPLAIQPCKKQKLSMSYNCSKDDVSSSNLGSFCSTLSETSDACKEPSSCCSKLIDPCTSTTQSHGS